MVLCSEALSGPKTDNHDRAALLVRFQNDRAGKAPLAAEKLHNMATNAIFQLLNLPRLGDEFDHPGIQRGGCCLRLRFRRFFLVPRRKIQNGGSIYIQFQLNMLQIHGRTSSLFYKSPSEGGAFRLISCRGAERAYPG